jgi:hypothetical protein
MLFSFSLSLELYRWCWISLWLKPWILGGLHIAVLYTLESKLWRKMNCRSSLHQFTLFVTVYYNKSDTIPTRFSRVGLSSYHLKVTPYLSLLPYRVFWLPDVSSMFRHSVYMMKTCEMRSTNAYSNLFISFCAILKVILEESFFFSGGKQRSHHLFIDAMQLHCFFQRWIPPCSYD